MLKVPTAVLEETFEHFRTCGEGWAECVVYWLGPLDAAGVIDRVVHPLHSATAAGYDVDGAWVTSFWLELARERRQVRAQVHTHPGSTFHSSRDDRMALIQTGGYLSLVIPNFGLGEVGLGGVYLAKRDEQGIWREAEIAAEVELV